MSNIDNAKQVYEESVSELNKILGSFTATGEQKESAQKALETLSTRYGATIITEVEGRTALLNDLVSELNTVIAAVQVNPISGTLDTFNSLVDTAKNIIGKEG